jgi:hypothetical protein
LSDVRSYLLTSENMSSCQVVTPDSNRSGKLIDSLLQVLETHSMRLYKIKIDVGHKDQGYD